MERMSAAEMSAIFGKPISITTRGDLLESGALVDLMTVAPSVVRQHFPITIVGMFAMTAGVAAIIDKAVKNPNHLNDYNGVVHDLLFMSKLRNRRNGLFRVIITGAGRNRYWTFRRVDNHDGILFLLPDED